MGESRIRNAFSRTTILTVGRLLIFIVLGFAGGLFLGVVSEEPELLAGHLRGDTRTIQLEPSLADDRTAGVASELAAGSVDAGSDGVGEESVDPALAERALPDVAANRVEPEEPSLVARLGAWASGGGDAETSEVGVGASRGSASVEAAGAAAWAIQVGAFGDSASAEGLADQLERDGYPVAVLPASATSSRWRVRVQPIGNEAEARSVAKRIEREERLPTWVLRIEASAGR